MRTPLRSVLLLTITVLTITPVAVHAAGPATKNPSLATFEGTTIDLSKSWEQATACIQVSTGIDCYRTETELNQHYPMFTADTNAIEAVCSTGVHLYRGTSFGGATMIYTTRLTVINLSATGFDNDTSSYKIGGCASSFYASPGLAGGTYPGNTAANASATSMVSGWDNVVSSIFIN